MAGTSSCRVMQGTCPRPRLNDRCAPGAGPLQNRHRPQRSVRALRAVPRPEPDDSLGSIDPPTASRVSSAATRAPRCQRFYARWSWRKHGGPGVRSRRCSGPDRGVVRMGSGVSEQGHHPDRALRRRRADGHRGAARGPGHEHLAQAADRRGERGRGRGHHRREPGGQGLARWLHDSHPPHRHVDRPGPLPQAPRTTPSRTSSPSASSTTRR